ncbi:MAG: Gfo/Idh/MocA family oxidoreductase [Chloroflexi bacterium]|nr:Gfo/Idh/MocA family oxidoreductase [Chloroflexota bacterium]
MSALRAVTIANSDLGGAGHGLHRAWQANPDVRMVALADPVDEGREELAAACGAQRTYADYREMLERERPDIVAIARHWYDDGRVEETLAAIEAGAKGLYVEKPLAPWADQARAVMKAAEAAGTHVILAHRSREHPGMQAIRARGEAGEWGAMTRIRAMDKGDHRVGVEESMIHAPHVFDAMLYLVGEAPVQVSGLVLQDGRPATRADAAGRTENGAGPIAGDRVSATYLFPSGVIGTFESVPVGDGSYGSDRLGADCYYQEALVTLRNQPRGQFHVLPRGDVFPTGDGVGWEAIQADEPWAPEGVDAMTWSNHLHGCELVRLIHGGEVRPTTCTGQDALIGVEMLVGAYRSHLERRPIALPLEDPTNPWV